MNAPLRLRSASTAPARAPTPMVSVVIPTYRRPKLLRRCLDALLDQVLAPRHFEIIVCDDGPDEATRAEVMRVRDIGRKRGISITYCPVVDTQGPAGARNRGWRIARAPLVAFTDDDTIPDRHWLSRGCRAAADRAVSAVSGRVQVPLPSRASDYERDAAGLASAEFVTANCFVKRTMLERVGGFDERYTTAWREDSDLQFAILEAGGVIRSSPEAIVVHPLRPAAWGVSIKQQRKSQFDALLYKKHRRLFRTRIASPPFRYYAIVGSALLAGLALMSGQWMIAAGAASLWTLLTLAFIAHRLRNTRRDFSHVAEMTYTSILVPPLSLFWRWYGACRFRVLR